MTRPAPIEGYRRDPLCRFYTETGVGDVLVGAMGRHPPRRIVDLASGAGALGAAAFRKWRSSSLVSVDIDSDLSEVGTCGRRRHIVADALDADLPQLLARDGATFDATLCNPPYIVPQWRTGFDRILEEAGLSDARGLTGNASAEVLFAAQNLRCVADGGRIGLIVPDGLITGRRSSAFRAAVAASNRIDSVIELPRGAFKRTEAKAYVLVIRKGQGPSRRMRLGRVDAEGRMDRPLWLPARSAAGRLDYGYHAEMGMAGAHTLALLGAEIARGTVEPNASAPNGAPTFHTTHFPVGASRTAHALPEGYDPTGSTPCVMAQVGDILMARVDRSLERKVCIVASGSAAITSSVYRVRVDEAWRDVVSKALISPAGERRLAAAARGVGARMLSKADLLSMPLPL